MFYAQKKVELINKQPTVKKSCLVINLRHENYTVVCTTPDLVRNMLLIITEGCKRFLQMQAIEL